MYYVVFCILAFATIDEAKTKAPDDIAAHLARSREFHERGDLVMAGAFLDKNEEPLSTMGILTTREAAEEYVRGDPFVLNGMVTKWYIREWANLLA